MNFLINIAHCVTIVFSLLLSMFQLSQQKQQKYPVANKKILSSQTLTRQGSKPISDGMTMNHHHTLAKWKKKEYPKL